MIDRELKRSLGQMMHGVQVVGASHDGVSRAYCSHWVSQVSFEEPIVMASVSPKHDTYPLLDASGRFSVSIMGADQVEAAQYFSYPGRKFRYLAPEFLDEVNGLPRVIDCIAWLECEVIDRIDKYDHELFFAKVVNTEAGRLKFPPLLYSSRLGWRASGDKAREPGTSVRDGLLARLEALDNAEQQNDPPLADET